MLLICHAVSTKNPTLVLIVHLDRGIQYCRKKSKELLDKYECPQSMSSTGDCYDYGVTEHFFQVLKLSLCITENMKATIKLTEYLQVYCSALSPCSHLFIFRRDISSLYELKIAA